MATIGWVFKLSINGHAWVKGGGGNLWTEELTISVPAKA